MCTTKETVQGSFNNGVARVVVVIAAAARLSLMLLLLLLRRQPPVGADTRLLILDNTAGAGPASHMPRPNMSG